MKLGMTFEVLNMDDNYIAVPVRDDTSKMHGVLQLNEEAAAIINLLQEEITKDQIVEELLKEYDSSEDELRMYVHNFIEQLRAHDLIVE